MLFGQSIHVKTRHEGQKMARGADGNNQIHSRSYSKREGYSPRISPTIVIKVWIRVAYATANVGVVHAVDTRVTCGY